MWEDDFHKSFQVLEKLFFSFFHFTFIFFCFHCSINLKRQSELSGLGPDTNSLVDPIFVTNVTEYLCSGGFFFLQTNFDFLTSHF